MAYKTFFGIRCPHSGLDSASVQRRLHHFRPARARQNSVLIRAARGKIAPTGKIWRINHHAGSRVKRARRTNSDTPPNLNPDAGNFGIALIASRIAVSTEARPSSAVPCAFIGDRALGKYNFGSDASTNPAATFVPPGISTPRNKTSLAGHFSSPTNLYS